MDAINASSPTHWLQWGRALLPKTAVYEKAIQILAVEAQTVNNPAKVASLKEREISYLGMQNLAAAISKEPTKDMIVKFMQTLACDELRVLDIIEMLHVLRTIRQTDSIPTVLSNLKPSDAKHLLREILSDFDDEQADEVLRAISLENLHAILEDDKPESYIWPIFRDSIAWHEQKVKECDFNLSVTPPTFAIPNALRELHENYLHELQRLEDQSIKDKDLAGAARIRLERIRYYHESPDQLGKYRSPAIIDQEINQAILGGNIGKIRDLVQERLQYCLSDPVQKRSRKRDDIWAEWEPFVRKNIEVHELWEEALTCLLKDQIDIVPQYDEGLPVNAKIAHLFKLYHQKELTDYIIQLRNKRIKNQSLMSPRGNDADQYEERAFNTFSLVLPKLKPQLKERALQYLKTYTREQQYAATLEKILSYPDEHSDFRKDMQVLSIKRLNCQDVEFISLIDEFIRCDLSTALKTELNSLRQQYTSLNHEAQPLLIHLGWQGQAALLETCKEMIDNWLISPRDINSLFVSLFKDYDDWKLRHSFASEPTPPFELSEITDFQNNPIEWLEKMQGRVEQSIDLVKEEAAIPFLTTDQLISQLNAKKAVIKSDDKANTFFLLGQYYRAMDDHISHLRFQTESGELTVNLLKHSIRVGSELWKAMLHNDPKLEPIVKAIKLKKTIDIEMKEVHEHMHRPNLQVENVVIGIDEPALYFVEKLNTVYQVWTVSDLRKLGISEWSDIPKFLETHPKFFEAFLQFEKKGAVAGFPEFIKGYTRR